MVLPHHSLVRIAAGIDDLAGARGPAAAATCLPSPFGHHSGRHGYGCARRGSPEPPVHSPPTVVASSPEFIVGEIAPPLFPLSMLYMTTGPHQSASPPRPNYFSSEVVF